MITPLIIRPAAPGDLDAVWQLCRTVKTQLTADGISIWDDTYPSPQVFAEDIAANSLLLAFRGEQLLGAVSVTDNHSSEYYFDLPTEEADVRTRALLAHCGAQPETSVGLHRLMVAPAARRTGIAAALLNEAIRRSPGKRITLLVAGFNAPALTLYRDWGFVGYGEFEFSFGRMHLMALPLQQ